MHYKNSNGEIWSVGKGDWVCSQYMDESDMQKRIRTRKLIFITSFIFYLFISAILILF